MAAEITRELLQTTPLADLPGWEVRLFLISYPPGADANNHSHPVVGAKPMKFLITYTVKTGQPNTIFDAHE